MGYSTGNSLRKKSKTKKTGRTRTEDEKWNRNKEEKKNW